MGMGLLAQFPAGMVIPRILVLITLTNNLVRAADQVGQQIRLEWSRKAEVMSGDENSEDKSATMSG